MFLNEELKFLFDFRKTLSKSRLRSSNLSKRFLNFLAHLPKLIKNMHVDGSAMRLVSREKSEKKNITDGRIKGIMNVKKKKDQSNSRPI